MKQYIKRSRTSSPGICPSLNPNLHPLSPSATSGPSASLCVCECVPLRFWMCVSESGAGGGIQSVMQKCLPCTECEILKTAAWSVESRDCGRGRGGGMGQ